MKNGDFSSKNGDFSMGKSETNISSIAIDGEYFMENPRKIPSMNGWKWGQPSMELELERSLES